MESHCALGLSSLGMITISHFYSALTFQFALGVNSLGGPPPAPRAGQAKGRTLLSVHAQRPH